MSELMQKKNEIIEKFGEDSPEVKYAQHVFAKRPTAQFLKLYKELMGLD